jgi:CubicO group peptidase (beta-lactamase class C family)
MDDRLIGPDDLAREYVPQWGDDPLKSRITVQHLATHTSGIENVELSDEGRRQELAEGVAVGARGSRAPDMPL